MTFLPLSFCPVLLRFTDLSPGTGYGVRGLAELLSAELHSKVDQRMPRRWMEGLGSALLRAFWRYGIESML